MPPRRRTYPYADQSPEAQAAVPYEDAAGIPTPKSGAITMPQLVRAVGGAGHSPVKRLIRLPPRPRGAARVRLWTMRTLSRQRWNRRREPQSSRFPELLLLVDAVLSSRFLTQRKATARSTGVKRLAPARQQAAGSSACTWRHSRPGERVSVHRTSITASRRAMARRQKECRSLRLQVRRGEEERR